MKLNRNKAALVLAGALACAQASAGTVSFIEAPLAPPSTQVELTLQAQLDSLGPQAGKAAPSGLPGGTATALGVEREVALASTTTMSPADISVAIWHVIRTMKALQFNKPLELVDAKVKVVDTITPKVSAVPLPAAAWLLVMGLMGFVGRRFTQKPADRDSASAPSRGTLPLGAQPA